MVDDACGPVPKRKRTPSTGAPPRVTVPLIYTPPECVQLRKSVLYGYSNGSGVGAAAVATGDGVAVAGATVRVGVRGTLVGVFVGTLVGEGTSVGVDVAVGAAVGIGVSVSTGVHVGGDSVAAAKRVGEGSGGLKGLNATRGFRKTSKSKITTSAVMVATTRVAI